MPVELAAFLSVWGIFAAGLFICSLKMHRVLQITLMAVVLLVILLVTAQLTGNALILNLGGLVGLVVGGVLHSTWVWGRSSTKCMATGFFRYEPAFFHSLLKK
jgi:succinate-acetate transporter protein